MIINKLFISVCRRFADIKVHVRIRSYSFTERFSGVMSYFLHLSQYEPKPIFQCNHSEFRINILSLQALVTTTHEAMRQINLNNEVVIYQNEDGKTQLDVKLEGETVWLTQA